VNANWLLRVEFSVVCWPGGLGTKDQEAELQRINHLPLTATGPSALLGHERAAAAVFFITNNGENKHPMDLLIPICFI
jgi:hypothetical protein